MDRNAFPKKPEASPHECWRFEQLISQSRDTHEHEAELVHSL